MFRGMDMNDKNMSGEMAGKIITDKNAKNTGEKMMDTNRTGSGLLRRKKFPMGWLLPVAVLSFFLAQVWSFAPVFRGIVSVFVFSKFLAGLCGTHFLL